MKPYEHKVQYYETDAMGIVHHSNYIRWFEEARCDMLEQMGFGYRKMEEEGVIIPVLSVACNYKSMVRFEETVVILSTVTEFNGIKFKVTYEIRDSETNELRTTGESTHCFLSRAHQPLRLKKEYPHIYSLFASMQAI
ncbi:MAG: acyl-CoA thioesterase [Lachnospiraceae bacterium]|nr:acyl-CoA thioesterase [Lachnospiraceae bacterium]